MSYVSLEEMKNSLDASGLTYLDQDLTNSIAAASTGVEEYCDRIFTTGGTAEVRYFSPLDNRALTIDDLTSLVKLESDYDGDGTYETTWTQNRDFVLEPANNPAIGKPYETVRVHPRGAYRFSPFPSSVKITGQYGWAVTPAGVKEATAIMAERLMRRKRDAPFGVVGMGFENSAVRIPRVDPDLEFLLEPYVRGCGVMAS